LNNHYILDSIIRKIYTKGKERTRLNKKQRIIKENNWKNNERMDDETILFEIHNQYVHKLFLHKSIWIIDCIPGL
jgi:hypothetical protein